MVRVVLASGSPRRRDFLASLDLSFDVVAADIDESTRVGESPRSYVERLAREKAQKVVDGLERNDHERVVVVAADTTVTIDGEILGKPVDERDGRAMLRRISGRSHDVLTGFAVAVMDATGIRIAHDVATTIVTVANLTDSDIDWYISTGEGRDKAGGYGIQGRAAVFVESISGSASNVAGLPMAQLYELLRSVGVPLEVLRGEITH